MQMFTVPHTLFTLDGRFISFHFMLIILFQLLLLKIQLISS